MYMDSVTLTSNLTVVRMKGLAEVGGWRKEVTG